MPNKQRRPAEASRRSARAASKAIAKARQGIREVPGPSPNPATNLLIADIAIRGAGRLFRRAMEKGLLRARFDPEQANAIVEGRSLSRTLVSTAIARVATRSVPGFLVVGSGLIAKTLVDRSISRRKSRRRGDKALAKDADQS